ncbi:MAG: L-threonylcarbamoyladenylate synthase [Planctomycetota bacterium]|nr:L-threonylcarbamoyladenylate synthase [Planctomycetota bacterium]
MTTVLSYTDDHITLAAAALERGEVVAFATETVYGLGALTFREEAIRQIYELKGRPFDNPLIAHVLDLQHASRVAHIPNWVPAELALAFWPGPLTMILPRRSDVPSIASGGLDTIAVRAPKHPVARALLHATDCPISAPSANRSGGISATLASHVAEDFEGEELLILDGGASSFGIESTVIDLCGPLPVVRRLGAVGVEALHAVIGALEVHIGSGQSSSPGSTTRHYAPNTPTKLITRNALASELAQGAASVIGTRLPVLDPPHQSFELFEDEQVTAMTLYNILRRADRSGSPRILIVQPENEGDLWDAIRDRLQRASS